AEVAGAEYVDSLAGTAVLPGKNGQQCRVVGEEAGVEAQWTEDSCGAGSIIRSGHAAQFIDAVACHHARPACIDQRADGFMAFRRVVVGDKVAVLPRTEAAHAPVLIVHSCTVSRCLECASEYLFHPLQHHRSSPWSSS